MLKVQRGLGLALVAAGAWLEASTLWHGWRLLPLYIPDALVTGRCLAAFGSALYALSMTGSLTHALPSLLPVPLSPVVSVLHSWRRGDLARAMPRRLASMGEVVGLALALTLAGAGLRKVHPGALMPVRAPAAAAPAPAILEAAPAPATVNYRIDFEPGSAALSEEAYGVLARIADTMHYYPLDDLQLSVGSPDDAGHALATARADAVRRVLVERHGLKTERIRSFILEGAAPGHVDVTIIPN